MREFLRLEVNPRGLLIAAGALACVGTVTGFFGQLWWIFDLTSHFRVQYAAGLFVLAGVLVFSRRWQAAMMVAAFSALNWAVIAPYCYFGHVPASPAKRVLRVLLLNVHTENRRFDLVEEFIRENRPDLVVLEEVNEEWLRKLAGLRTEYPHGPQEPRDDNFGIALLSRLLLEESEIVYLGDAEVPSVTAVMQFEGKSLKVLGTHPVPPSGRENSHLRNHQLNSVRGFLAGWRGPVVLLGDLNTTPWSPHFQAFLRDAGMIDSARGLGWQTTWPTFLFPMRIAIDHCLLSRDLRVVARRVGWNLGSDHLPLLVDLASE